MAAVCARVQPLTKEHAVAPPRLRRPSQQRGDQSRGTSAWQSSQPVDTQRPPSQEFTLLSRGSQVRVLPGALFLIEGLRPSNSPTRSLACRFAGSLRSRGSLAPLARPIFIEGLRPSNSPTRSLAGPPPAPLRSRGSLASLRSRRPSFAPRTPYTLSRAPHSRAALAPFALSPAHRQAATRGTRRGSSACSRAARATRATRASGGGAPRALSEVRPRGEPLRTCASGDTSPHRLKSVECGARH